MVGPQAKRAAVAMLMTERDFGVTRACGLIGISRSLYRYRSRRQDSVIFRHIGAKEFSAYRSQRISGI